MKITQQHPQRGDWSVLTDTSAPRLRGPSGYVGPDSPDGGVTFECYGVSTKGDRIEYRIHLTVNELRAMSKALKEQT